MHFFRPVPGLQKERKWFLAHVNIVLCIRDVFMRGKRSLEMINFKPIQTQCLDRMELSGEELLETVLVPSFHMSFSLSFLFLFSFFFFFFKILFIHERHGEKERGRDREAGSMQGA